MDLGTIVAVGVPLIAAILGIVKALLLLKDKDKLAALVDAITDGVETAGDAFTKGHIKSFAIKTGTKGALDKALDAKGYRRNLR